MTGDRLVIAVDGGNSKTDVALLDTSGAVLASVRGQGSSPHRLGLQQAIRLVDDLIARGRFEAGIDGRSGEQAAAAAVFMAGADLPDEERALDEAVRAQGWAEHTLVANDAFAVLWAATATGEGLAITVGAGSNCVGRAPDGRRAWFPALGEITGDWGGGPDIGMAALGAGVRSEDGRAPHTSLAAAVAAYFGEPTALDVAIAIHQHRLDITRLFELPPIVIEAAAAGDAAAMAIVDRQADEVVSVAIAGLKQLGMLDEPVDVVLGGSVLAAIGSLVLERIARDIAATAAHARTTLCMEPPVLGAALAALRLAGSGEDAIQRARNGLTRGAAGATVQAGGELA
ncbi:MAG TPA: BadF/BadG/BcrA/BcrD ATPase family protein [Candidatus Dormibacteraeota bacterium]|nr:BadF/BadG/BcrA/BcrD ATPase family protein [Candidatus Dormibacteraeota bacterium]